MSSIPSSAMPHAKAHDDEDETHEHGAPRHDTPTAEKPTQPTDEGTQAKLAEVKEQAATVQDKVTHEATKLAEDVKSEVQSHPKTSFAVGAAVAIGVAALAAIPFFLSKSDAEQPKPRKPKPKPAKGHKPKN